jgi:MFS superfamily sulfate permease-like transporter
VLVVTGWRLVSLDHVKHLYHHYGVMPALIWAGTLFMVVTTDLLTGVLTGLVLSLLELVPHLRDLKLEVKVEPKDAHIELQICGRATFLSLPKLTRILDDLPNADHIRLNLSGLAQLDHTCAEVLADWIQRSRKAGARVELVGPSEIHTGNSHRRLTEAASL